MHIIKSNKAKSMALVKVDHINDHIDQLGMFSKKLLIKAIKKLPDDDIIYIDLINQMFSVTGVNSKKTFMIAPIQFESDPK